MSCWQKAQTIAIFLAPFSLVSTAYSDEARYEVGLRTNVLLGDGVPANDILGLGVIGRYNLRHGWFAGAALDTYEMILNDPQ